MRMLGSDAILRSLEAGASTSLRHPVGRSSRSTTASPVAPPAATSLARHSRARAHVGVIRTGLRPRGRALATFGPGRHEPRHADRRRVDGLHAARLHHRPGALSLIARTRSRRRRDRDHAPHRQHSWLVGRRRTPARSEGGFHIARTGRSGPVLVDVSQGRTGGGDRLHYPHQVDLPGGNSLPASTRRQVREAREPCSPPRDRPLRRRRGDQRRGPARSFRELAETAGIPSCHPDGHGLPESHPLATGRPACTAPNGRTGPEQADLIVAVGARFDTTAYGKRPGIAAREGDRPFDIDAARDREASGTRTSRHRAAQDLTRRAPPMRFAPGGSGTRARSPGGASSTSGATPTRTATGAKVRS